MSFVFFFFFKGLSIVDSELHQYKKSIVAHWDIARPVCLLWFYRKRIDQVSGIYLKDSSSSKMSRLFKLTEIISD